EDPSAAKSEKIFGCPEHLEESYIAARDSIILLKNDIVGTAPALPICGSRPVATNEAKQAADDATRVDFTGRKVNTIAVIGPNADSVRAQFGDWTFFTHPLPNLDAVPTFHVTTMLEGISTEAKNNGIKVLNDKGCDIFDAKNHSIPKALKIAEEADIVFLAVGDTLSQTGEGKDRSNLALSGAQNELAEALATVCRKKSIPLVSILVNGKPLEFDRVAQVSDAILETFNSGTLGGRATADIIFGKAEPKGRLPISFPRTTGQLPVYYNQLPGWHDGKYYDCDASPLFSFGEGLSYTAFKYNSITLSKETIKEGETINVQVSLTNIGQRTGTETVQLYITDCIASVVRPVRELKNFAQIVLLPGETGSVTLQLKAEDLALIDEKGKTILEPGEFLVQCGHDSREISLIHKTLTLM
ncbi:MAG TPA: glycoside hydrolase family 3 C-terminal domain-containing protein, partial [Treponemataceae bacterium]|nr:glycoside hydrolase family 3 C-terminal domain-containing protein [Treponemataceae bacterium]